MVTLFLVTLFFFSNPFFSIPAILSTRRFGFLSYNLGKPFYISVFTVDFIMELLQLYKQQMFILCLMFLTAVNHIFVFHKFMNGCKKSIVKGLLGKCIYNKITWKSEVPIVKTNHYFFPCWWLLNIMSSAENLCKQFAHRMSVLIWI